MPVVPSSFMVFVKFILILLLGFIVVSLFSGLYYLVKDKGQTRRTVNALSVRIGLSILTILVVIAAAALGIIDFKANPLSPGASARSTDNEAGVTGQNGSPPVEGNEAAVPAHEQGSGRRRVVTPDQ